VPGVVFRAHWLCVRYALIDWVTGSFGWFDTADPAASLTLSQSRDETVFPSMSEGAPEPTANVYKRKRPSKDIAVDTLDESMPNSTPSGAVAVDTVLPGTVTPGSSAPRSAGGRKRKPSPQPSPEEEGDDDLAGPDGGDSDGDSPGTKQLKALTGGKWTKAEDDLLRTGVEEIGAKNWKAISVRFLKGKRTDVQCLHRWQKVCHAVEYVGFFRFG
jgi:hypothetical protein